MNFSHWNTLICIQEQISLLKQMYLHIHRKQHIIMITLTHGKMLDIIICSLESVDKLVQNSTIKSVQRILKILQNRNWMIILAAWELLKVTNKSPIGRENLSQQLKSHLYIRNRQSVSSSISRIYVWPKRMMNYEKAVKFGNNWHARCLNIW